MRAATLGRRPILFLRSRTNGYGNAIEQVIKSIELREDFCDALVNIVGCETLRQDDEPQAGLTGRLGPFVVSSIVEWLDLIKP